MKRFNPSHPDALYKTIAGFMMMVWLYKTTQRFDKIAAGPSGLGNGEKPNLIHLGKIKKLMLEDSSQ